MVKGTVKSNPPNTGKSFMPVFTKHIAHPGSYMASTPKGGRVRVNITQQRLQKFVSNFKRMRKDGIKIPAPWKHDIDSFPRTAKELKALAKESKANPGSRINAGFWEDLYLDKSGRLMGKLNVPLKKDAEKVGTSVTEVSPYIKPSFLAGNGQTYEDAILHIALVNHPIIPGQDNFVPEEAATLSNGFAFEMSNRIGWADEDEDLELSGEDEDEEEDSDGEDDDESDTEESAELDDDSEDDEDAEMASRDDDEEENSFDSDDDEGLEDQAPGSKKQKTINRFSEAMKVLRGLGLAIPKDADPETAYDYIVTAGNQKLLDKRESEGNDAEGLTKEPKGSLEQPKPVAMSLAELFSNVPEDCEDAEEIEMANKPGKNKSVSDEILDDGEDTGETGNKPGKKPSKPGKQAKPSSAMLAHPEVAALFSHAQANQRKSYVDRINKLIRWGTLSSKVAKTKLVPLLEGYQLSFNPQTKKVRRTELDTILDTLEAAAENNRGRMFSDITGGMSGAQFGFDDEGSLVEEEAGDLFSGPGPGELAGDISEEDADKVLDTQFANAGHSEWVRPGANGKHAE